MDFAPQIPCASLCDERQSASHGVTFAVFTKVFRHPCDFSHDKKQLWGLDSRFLAVLIDPSFN